MEGVATSSWLATASPVSSLSSWQICNAVMPIPYPPCPTSVWSSLDSHSNSSALSFYIASLPLRCVTHPIGDSAFDPVTVFSSLAAGPAQPASACPHPSADVSLLLSLPVFLRERILRFPVPDFPLGGGALPPRPLRGRRRQPPLQSLVLLAGRGSYYLESLSQLPPPFAPASGMSLTFY